MISHVISVWSATWSVHDQPNDKCMISKWSVHDQSRDKCMISEDASMAGCLVRSLFLTYKCPSSCCILTWQKDSQLIFWPLLIRALIPFMRAPPSWPNYFPKILPSCIITLGLWFWIYRFGGGGHKHSSIALSIYHQSSIKQGPPTSRI